MTMRIACGHRMSQVEGGRFDSRRFLDCPSRATSEIAVWFDGLAEIVEHALNNGQRPPSPGQRRPSTGRSAPVLPPPTSGPVL